MTSPQNDYTYDERLHYLGVAKTALANFNERYTRLDVSRIDIDGLVLIALRKFIDPLHQVYAKKIAYLDEDELEGIDIGTRAEVRDLTRTSKTIDRLEMVEKRFEEDLEKLVALYSIQLKMSYMEWSKLTAKFTAGRIQELHRLEEWVDTQYEYLAKYHIEEVEKWSPVDGVTLRFTTQTDDISTVAGTYFLFNRGDLIYIGHSTNLRKRLKNHEIVQQYYSNTEDFDIECVYVLLPISSARKVEREMIALVKPEYNEKGTR